MSLNVLTPGFSVLPQLRVVERVRPAAHRDRSGRLIRLGVPAVAGIDMPVQQVDQAQKPAAVGVGNPSVDVPGFPSRGAPV